MPVDTLFNPLPQESCLKRIESDDYSPVGGLTIWNNYMNKFEEKYLECEKKWKQRGLKIKSLESVKFPADRSFTRIHYIHSKHVWLHCLKLDLTKKKLLTSECNPGMKILSVEGPMRFIINNDSIIRDRGLKIKTMRLLHQWKFMPYDIFNRKIVIESLDLHNSLNNLTAEFFISGSVSGYYDCHLKACENIFTKKYYYNLKNVNIILHIQDEQSMDWFFKLLKDNQKILKYQFKQLHIAILKKTFSKKRVYFVFEWNKNMNDKILKQLENRFDGMTHDDQNQKQFEEKFSLMRVQWLD